MRELHPEVQVVKTVGQQAKDLPEGSVLLVSDLEHRTPALQGTKFIRSETVLHRITSLWCSTRAVYLPAQERARPKKYYHPEEIATFLDARVAAGSRVFLLNPTDEVIEALSTPVNEGDPEEDLRFD